MTVVATLLLLLAGYLPWMVIAPDATHVADIGSYMRGYQFDTIEVVFVISVGAVSSAIHGLPSKTASGVLLGLLGLGYSVLPHYLVAQSLEPLPRGFELATVGPALVSVSACLMVASGTLLAAGALPDEDTQQDTGTRA